MLLKGPVLMPDVAIVDSIQTMFDEEIGSAPGSVSQVRESTNVLMQIAKGLGITIFIVPMIGKLMYMEPRVGEELVPWKDMLLFCLLYTSPSPRD